MEGALKEGLGLVLGRRAGCGVRACEVCLESCQVWHTKGTGWAEMLGWSRGGPEGLEELVWVGGALELLSTQELIKCWGSHPPGTALRVSSEPLSLPVPRLVSLVPSPNLTTNAVVESNSGWPGLAGGTFHRTGQGREGPGVEGSLDQGRPNTSATFHLHQAASAGHRLSGDHSDTRVKPTVVGFLPPCFPWCQ